VHLYCVASQLHKRARHCKRVATTARVLLLLSVGVAARHLTMSASSGKLSEPLLTAAADDATPFEAHAFSVFSSEPSSHVAAPVLLDCLAHAADDAGLFLDKAPDSAAALSDEQREWVRRTLVACGFELKADGVLHASADVLDRLRKEQNAARKRAHADAAATRERLLSDALRRLDASVEAAPQPLTLGAARFALSKFLVAFHGQPAVGPLLLGLAALLRAQATALDGTARCWILERAAILNGGDAFVDPSAALLGACGVKSASAAAVAEEAEAGRAPTEDELVLRVADGSWTHSELAALASYLERKSSRAAASSGFGGRASGRVVVGGAYEPRTLASLGEWLGALLSTWLTRLAP
jgi:hypothetical protein